MKYQIVAMSLKKTFIYLWSLFEATIFQSVWLVTDSTLVGNSMCDLKLDYKQMTKRQCPDWVIPSQKGVRNQNYPIGRGESMVVSDEREGGGVEQIETSRSPVIISTRLVW